MLEIFYYIIFIQIVIILFLYNS